MPNPYHWAVVVGIDQYPAFTKLSCARRDAQSFHEWLLHPEGGGLEPGNISLVTRDLPVDASAAQAAPTMDEIFDAIEDKFTQAEQAVEQGLCPWEDTRLYIYFSGHGISRGARDASLLAANATAKNLGRHVSCKLLDEFFREQRYFQDLVIFADCCRDDKRGKVSTGAFVPWTLGTEVGDGPPRTFYGCAADLGQKAYEEQAGPEEYRRGYFTRCLLEALNNRTGMASPTLDANALTSRLKGLLGSLSSIPGSPPQGFKPDLESSNADDLTFGISGNTPEYLVRFSNVPASAHLRILNEAETAVDTFPVPPGEDKIERRLPLGGFTLELSNDQGQSFQLNREFKIAPGYNQIALHP